MLKPQTWTMKAHNGRRSLCECDSETWDADADSNIVPSCLALQQGLGTRSSNMHQCCHLSHSNHCHWGLQMLRDGQKGTAKVTEQRERGSLEKRSGLKEWAYTCIRDDTSHTYWIYWVVPSFPIILSFSLRLPTLSHSHFPDEFSANKPGEVLDYC